MEESACNHHIWFYLKMTYVNGDTLEDCYFKKCDDCETIHESDEDEYLDNALFFIEELAFSNN
jgi:hypothetical protein